MKRTHLPLNALRVFDAAARHLSFTKAADELAVTPAAVGQQIRSLEDMLGTLLFRRMTRNLELTEEGAHSLPALREGLAKIEESVAIMQAGQADDRLTLAAPRDFIAKWLSLRLAGFRAANPARQIILLPADGPVDFGQANLDAAIYFGALPAEEEYSGVRIAEEAFVVVLAADVIADVKTVKALAKLPLIEHPTSNWRHWFEAHGARMPADEGCLSVADAGLAIEAAVSGYGAARVPHTLAAGDIEAGRLTVFGEREPTDDAYWLIAPSAQWRQAKVKDLVAAMTTGG